MGTVHVRERDGVRIDAGALGEYFAQVANEQSELGGLDCVRFVIEGIRIGAGIDFRDRLGYWDRRSAVRRLRGSRGLDAAFREALGDPDPPESLDICDIAFFAPHSVGLVMPGYVALKSRATIWRIALDQAKHGWRIG